MWSLVGIVLDFFFFSVACRRVYGCILFLVVCILGYKAVLERTIHILIVLELFS